MGLSDGEPWQRQHIRNIRRDEPKKNPFVVSLSNHALAIDWKIKSAPGLARKAWFDKLTTNGIFDRLTTNGILGRLANNGGFDKPVTNRNLDKVCPGLDPELTTNGVKHSYLA